ncbi:MAG TPA: chloride channel protein, partial [Cyclobacteriaceae bacterium]|nr:chloride channel protein [Cyclobacteriaceae bacterium]
LLGLFCGLISIYHSRVFVRVDNLFDRIKHSYAKAITGGALLAVLIFLFPPLFGEGYNSIIALSELNTQNLLANSAFRDYLNNEWLVLLFMAAIIFMKVFATAATLSSGGNGGNFAPSLMVGAFSGFVFARFVNLTGFTRLPESNFTLVAMAGVMTGVMHAPLTAIFLIAEITGGYGLMVPLMMVASVSYVVAKLIEPDSIDSKKLAKKGELITHDRDKKILSYIALEGIIEKDFQPVHEKDRLRELITTIEQSHRNVYPVITADNKLAGIIRLDSIREMMFQHALYDTVFIKELMQKPPAIVSIDESMESVMQKFDETGAWNLPVVSNGVYAGFISKSVIFNKYRNHLIERSVH